MLVGWRIVGKSTRRGDGWSVRGLTTRTPIQHSIRLAMVRHTNEVAAATARLSLTSVHGEPAIHG